MEVSICYTCVSLKEAVSGYMSLSLALYAMLWLFIVFSWEEFLFVNIDTILYVY